MTMDEIGREVEKFTDMVRVVAEEKQQAVEECIRLKVEVERLQNDLRAWSNGSPLRPSTTEERLRQEICKLTAERDGARHAFTRLRFDPTESGAAISAPAALPTKSDLRDVAKRQRVAVVQAYLMACADDSCGDSVEPSGWVLRCLSTTPLVVEEP